MIKAHEYNTYVIITSWALVKHSYPLYRFCKKRYISKVIIIIIIIIITQQHAHGAVRALETFVNCQRPVFSLGASQIVYKLTNLWTLWLNWLSNLKENNEWKTHLLHYFVCFKCITNKRIQLKSFIIRVKNYLFPQNYESFLTLFYTFNSSPSLITK